MPHIGPLALLWPFMVSVKKVSSVKEALSLYSYIVTVSGYQWYISACGYTYVRI